MLIQAGASWCGPCNILKPMLIDAVKQHDGKLEYLYVDIDEHQNIAQLLRVSNENTEMILTSRSFVHIQI